MTDVAKVLGVQSYCFRNFKANKDVARMVRELGLTNIELCGVHFDIKKPETWDEVIRTYRGEGVDICSIGVYGFAADEAAERNYFEFAKRAGLKVLSCNFGVDKVPAAFRVAEKLADEYGINLAIHNHGGKHWLGCAQMMANVFANTSPRIGLCLDTAWAMHSHENPLALCEKFAARLYGLHLKDFTFDRAGNHEDVAVGTGNLDLAKLAATLKKGGFQGYAVLEYEADPDNPVPALKKCVDNVRAVNWT